jgi:hypothetical protein
MKVSKERLVQIIKEELENLQQEKNAPGEEAPQAASPENKQAMASKFKALYTQFPKIQGLDKAEIILLDKLLGAALKLSAEGSAKAGLTMALQKLGVDPDAK